MNYDFTSTAPVRMSPTLLAGKNVVVTGGTTEVGRAVASLLVGAGANVFVFARDKRELGEALALMECGPGSIQGIVADQANPDHIEHVFEQAKERFQTLDVLVNNATVGSECTSGANDGDGRFEFQATLYGYLDCTRHAAEWMKESRGGHIVNIGSVFPDSRQKADSLYVAAKSAIQGYSRSLGRELAQNGIKLSLIEPDCGDIDEPGIRNLNDPSSLSEITESQKQSIQAEDIASAVYYSLTQPLRANVSLIRLERIV